ncbi:exopolysaccharide biosynthesis protein [Brevundimonas aveniformis]|uniref:exopolysaccharide biosynthesis protein n=1 Tax=Brevundimonas aveniformis TaxID=370977 RepID=UPI00042389A1|nr:exopolysaccharide biosynthesis protein [Brevundimonas aveniformis]
MTTSLDTHTDDPGSGFIGLTRALAEAGRGEGLTLGDIRDRLDERGFGILILILSIPCLVPALYGVPQAIGIPILLLAGQLLIGMKEPWLPTRLLTRRCPQAWLDRMADFAEKRMGWFERLSRPRLQALSTGLGERFAALFMIIATITIVLPLVNTVPSVALAMLAVGLIQRDGLFVLLGAVVASLWAGALIAVALGLYYGATWATGLSGYFQ